MSSHFKNCLIAIVLVMFSAGSVVFASKAPALPQHTLIYFVRHGEAKSDKLTEQGEARAAILAATVRSVLFTNVFSSHTTRALQTVEAVAKSRGL